MKSKLIFILLTLATTIQLVGQEVKDSLPPKFLWGITVAPGLSKINTEFTEQPDETVNDYKSSFQFSSAIGLFVQKKFKNNFLLESGLLYSSIQGNESYNYEEGDENLLYPYYSTYQKTWVRSDVTNLKYLNLPIFLGYTYKKFTVLGGFQAGLNIKATNVTDATTCFNSIGTNCALFGGETYYIDMPKYSFDGVFKLHFNLGKGWLLGTKFYYQLTEKTYNFSKTKYFGANLSVQFIVNHKN